MAGIVQVVLSDSDIERLLRWYEGYIQAERTARSDDFLAERLKNYQAATACPGGECAVPRK